jgi:hypothetical protein
VKSICSYTSVAIEEKCLPPKQEKQYVSLSRLNIRRDRDTQMERAINQLSLGASRKWPNLYYKIVDVEDSEDTMGNEV